MIRRRQIPVRLVLLVAGYALTIFWVFTRSTPLGSARPVTIRLSHWQIERGPPDGLTAVIRRYEELHPRVKVEQVLVPGSIYRQWLRTNLTGGTATDIMEFAYFVQGVNDVPPRFFEPLTRFMSEPNPYNRGTAMERVPWRLTFTDGLYGIISQSLEIGQIYGVTLFQGSGRFFCNRELLRKITGGSVSPPRTMVDFRRLCAQTAEYSRKTGQVVRPLAGSRLNAQYLMELLMQSCATGLNLELDREGYLSCKQRQAMMAYLQGRWSYRRPELRAAYALLREITQQMRPGFAQLERDDAVQEFVRGEALFTYGGTVDATTLKTLAPFPVELMHVPQLTKDDPVVGPYIKGPILEGTLATGMEMYLNKDGRHKEEALDFLRFLTSVEGGQLFMDHSGWLSSIRSVVVPPELEIQRALPDGYSTGTFYMGIGPNSSLSFQQHLHLLEGERGGVEAFVNALEFNLPTMMSADLKLDIRDTLTGVRGVDSEIAAMNALNRLQPPDPERAVRQQTLAGNQTLSELNAYESTWVLTRHGVNP